jgi:hypothetical protein
VKEKIFVPTLLSHVSPAEILEEAPKQRVFRINQSDLEAFALMLHDFKNQCEIIARSGVEGTNK